MTKLVLGVSGRAGVGKDTFATMLADLLTEEGYNVSLYAFADPVKQVYSVMFEGDPYTNDRVLKEQTIIPNSGGRTMRRLLQIIGTEFGRALNPRIWVEHMEQRVSRLQTKDLEVVIITDIRFPDELQFVAHTLGGMVFDVQRNEPQPLPKWKLRIRHLLRRAPHISEQVEYRKSLDLYGGKVIHNELGKFELKLTARHTVAHTILPYFRKLVGSAGSKGE